MSLPSRPTRADSDYPAAERRKRLECSGGVGVCASVSPALRLSLPKTSHVSGSWRGGGDINRTVDPAPPKHFRKFLYFIPQGRRKFVQPAADTHRTFIIIFQKNSDLLLDFIKTVDMQ